MQDSEANSSETGVRQENASVSSSPEQVCFLKSSSTDLDLKNMFRLNLKTQSCTKISCALCFKAILSDIS